MNLFLVLRSKASPGVVWNLPRGEGSGYKQRFKKVEGNETTEGKGGVV